jgi:hypothetical protein
MEIEGLEGAVLRRRDLEQTCPIMVNSGNLKVHYTKGRPVAESGVPPVALA